MPVFNIMISEADHRKLRQDYEKMSAGWQQQARHSPPPTFEQWASERLIATTPVSAEEVQHMQLFSAIEKLVINLHLHNFCLVHLAKDGDTYIKASYELARMLVNYFRLPEQYVRRMQDVFTYYLKEADGLSAAPHEENSLHTSTALKRSFQEFSERTGTALDHLGAERAIGRIEGALALLVDLHVMKREVARENSAAFKLKARNTNKRR